MTRYLEWDYGRNTVTEYRREGECNQCGECCQGNVLLMSAEISVVLWLHNCTSTSGEGIWQEIEDDDQAERKFYTTLPALKEDTAPCPLLKSKLCAVHGTEKPVLCQHWPTGPHDLLNLPRCGYHFVAVNSWDIDASPEPVDH